MEKLKNNRHHVDLILSDEDFKEMLKKEDFEGITTHRELLRSFIRDGFCFRVDYGGLYEVATQISRLGNNVNQIAKVANESKSVSENQIDQMITLLKDIKKIANDEIRNSARIIKYQRTPVSYDLEKERGDGDGGN